MSFCCIKTKMTVAISLLIALLLSSLAFFGLFYLEGRLKELIFSQQYTMVSAVADQLDDKIRTAQTELTLVAKTMSHDLVTVPAKVDRFLMGRPDTLAMFDNGVYLFSTSGRLLAGTPIEPQMREMDFSHREYFKKTLATRKPQIPEPFISAQASRHPIVMFTAPVLDRSGKVIAILGGSIDLFKDSFLGKLARARQGDKGYLYLCSDSRLLLVHPDRDRILQKSSLLSGNQLLDAALAGFEGTGETVNSKGVELISSFKRLHSTGWVLAVNLPRTEAYAMVYQAQQSLYLALGVALSVAIIVVWLLMKYLTAPLLSMTGQVREFTARKDTSARIVAETGNEIGVLAEAFNTLLEELDSQKKEIKKQLDFSEVLLDTIPYPVYHKDCEGRILGSNRAFEEYLGLPKSQLIGKTAFEFQPTHLAEIYLKADQELFLKRGVQVYEASMLFADGVKHEVIFHKALISGPGGTIEGVVGTMLDITERKRSEEALEQTRRQMQLILDSAGEGIYGVDLDGRVTFSNPAAAKMTGYDQEELLGVQQHTVLHHTKADGATYPVEECPIHAAFRDGVTHYGCDEVFWRKDGSSFPVDFISNPILEGGALVGAVVVFKDITERVRSEEQLLKLSQAVMQNPVSVVITDLSGTIEFVNPRFTKITGYEPCEAIGKNPCVLKSGQTSPEVYRNMWATISSGRIWTGELYNQSKNGDFFWEKATISPIRNSAGVITHYMAFKEEITEHKRLEAQLRHAQKMEAVGQLAGGVAHDFNNILTAIMGFGHMLRRAIETGDPKHRHLDQILSAADRAAQLTSSLLTFSRKQVMTLVPTSLTGLADKHVKFLERVIGEDVTLETEFCSQALVVLADGGQIEQVFMNLATNGRDAMPDGGKLRFTLDSVTLGKEFYQQHGFGEPGRYALVTVSDSGLGMSQETQKKIFEPFFTTKDTGRGTGLGLSIVYGIVKQHNGFIVVSSELGVGTIFSVYLPLVSQEAKEQHPAAVTAPPGGDETILVAEDDSAVRALLESALLELGYNVILARDGQEAVELFMAHDANVDLAIFDVLMPRKKGKEACDELRQLDPTLKVLLLSGYDAEFIQSRGGLIDGVDLLTKPVQPMALARKVRQMLDG